MKVLWRQQNVAFFVSFCFVVLCWSGTSNIAGGNQWAHFFVLFCFPNVFKCAHIFFEHCHLSSLTKLMNQRFQNGVDSYLSWSTFSFTRTLIDGSNRRKNHFHVFIFFFDNGKTRFHIFNSDMSFLMKPYTYFQDLILFDVNLSVFIF